MQLAFVIALSTLAAEPSEVELDAAKLRAEMRLRAQQTTVSIRREAETFEAQLIAAPLFRYSDQPRDIVDATFWGWQSEGRPVAFQKIEVYRKAGRWHWFYCFASASEGLIEANWSAGERWQAKQPGVSWQRLADGPEVAESAARRLLQGRRIARRFTVQSTDEVAKIELPLRLLSKPIYAHGEPTEEIVFGFAANGTNPDALLLVRVSERGRGWEYAWIQMTTGKLTARLDKRVVWTAPYQVPNPARPSKFATWLFFRESAAGSE